MNSSISVCGTSQAAIDYTLAKLAHKWMLFRLPPARRRAQFDDYVPPRADGAPDQRFAQKDVDSHPVRQFLDVNGAGLTLARLAMQHLPPERYLAVVNDSLSRRDFHLRNPDYPVIHAAVGSWRGFGPFDRVFAAVSTPTEASAAIAATASHGRVMLVAHLSRTFPADSFPRPATDKLSVTGYAPPSFYQSRLTVGAARAYLRQTADAPDATLLVIRGHLP